VTVWRLINAVKADVETLLRDGHEQAAHGLMMSVFELLAKADYTFVQPPHAQKL
jgi:hypothetical protein